MYEYNMLYTRKLNYIQHMHALFPVKLLSIFIKYEVKHRSHAHELTAVEIMCALALHELASHNLYHTEKLCALMTELKGCVEIISYRKKIIGCEADAAL